ISLAGDLRVESRANLGIAGVDVERLPRFRIDEANKTDVGKNALTRILERHRDHVVPLRKQLERPLDVFAEEIGNEKDDGFVREHLVQVFRRAADVGASSVWLEGQDVADQAKRMTPALSRRDD